MSGGVVFVSYYTLNYKGWADKLRASLVAQKLEHDLVPIAHQTESKVGRDRWQANVRYKPQFILDMLEKHKDAKAVVWVDADGLVEQRPELLLKMREDLGVCFAPFPRKQPRKYELLSGTVYVANNPRSRKMMRLWVKAMPIVGERKKALKEPQLTKPEQQILQALLSIWKCIPEKHYNNADRVTLILKGFEKCNVSVKNLPEPYCHIRGNSGFGSGVITHGQASREWRWPEKARRRRRMMKETGRKDPFSRKKRRPKPIDAKKKKPNRNSPASRRRRRRMGG